MRGATGASPVHQGAEKRERDSKDEKSRRNHVAEDSDVGIVIRCHLINGKEKDECEERAGGQYHPGPAQPIPEMAGETRGRRRWVFGHWPDYRQANRKVSPKSRRDATASADDSTMPVDRLFLQGSDVGDQCLDISVGKFAA